MDPMLIKLAQTSFIDFVIGSLTVLHPNMPFNLGWYHEAMFHILAEAQAGRILRPVINVPPRSFKSTIISVIWPAYLLGIDPTTRIMVLTYNDEFAKDHTRLTRELMLSPFYKSVFPGTELTTKTSLHLRTDQRGERIAGSLMGKVTGRGAQYLILDDPTNASDVGSMKKRKRVYKTFRRAVLTRLNSPTADRIIVVAQRLHEDDLPGYLLRRGGWTHLKLQVRATEPARIALGGGAFKDVQVGELLDAARWPAVWIAQQELDMGTEFSAQYLQEPVPDTGRYIKKEWIGRYAFPIKRDGMEITISVDTAIKGGTGNDYSVCTVWGARERYHYLLHIYRQKVDQPTLVDDIASLVHEYGADNVLIEAQGSGQGISDYLRTNHGISSTLLRSRDGKEVRLDKASNAFKDMRVVFPDEAPWLASLLTELFAFPNARYDDQVDSVSQYLNWSFDREKGTFTYGFVDLGPSLDDEWDPLDAVRGFRPDLFL